MGPVVVHQQHPQGRALPSASNACGRKLVWQNQFVGSITLCNCLRYRFGVLTSQDVCSVAVAYPERRIMKKLNKVAMLFATAALATSASTAFAQTSQDNWKNVDGNVWKNGTNELCWRDNFWSPATADERCDGAPKKAAPAPMAAPVAPAPVAPPAPVVVPPVVPPPPVDPQWVSAPVSAASAAWSGPSAICSRTGSPGRA